MARRQILRIRVGRGLSSTGWAVVVLSMSIANLSHGQDETDSIDRDYQSELPRIKPLEPDEALASFQLADGFLLQQAAAEPLVVDPVAMSFDEAGRLYVVEMRDYSEHPDENLGRIRLLIDTDADGRFDDSRLFAEGLSWPTAIICYGGGVFVGAAPHIYFIKDNDGDGVADEQTIALTGFGRGNVQGLLNSFRWGMDHRIHGATSSSGATIIRPHSDQPPVTLRGRDFAFDPRTMEIEAISGGGQHGMSFNRWGEKFVCSNSNHFQFIVYDDRYLSRNPYVAAVAARIGIASDGPQADVFRSSPVEPWRIVRTRLRRQGIVPGPVERGGKAAGYFTGATGVTMYRGDAWPEEDRNWAFISDVGSNLIHRKLVESQGVRYVGHRADEGTEFLTSTDIWFRPVQLANGPDGALWILDMYREVIEHPASLHPVIKKHLDLDSGRDRGRIYRVAHESEQTPTFDRLDECTTDELVAALSSTNGWTRETASKLIFQSQDPAAGPALRDLLTAAPSAETVIWCLWTLDGIDQLTADVVVSALRHDNPHVRRHALQLSERRLDQSSELREAVLSLDASDEPRLRLQLAFTLGQLSGVRKNQALARLIASSAEDPYFRMAVQSSLPEGAGEVLAKLASETAFHEQAAGMEFLGQLAAQIGRQQRPEDIVLLAQALRALGEHSPEKAVTLIGAVAASPESELGMRLAAATGEQARDWIEQRVSTALATLSNADASREARVAAAYDLRWADAATAIGPLLACLSAETPADIQVAALDVLAGLTEDRIATELIGRWSSLTPNVRQRALDVLFTRASWTQALLSSSLKGKVASTDLDIGRLRGLATGKGEIADQAKALLSNLELNRDRAKVVSEYEPSLSLAGDMARGRSVFETQCAACHRVGQLGNDIGPNLAAMINRGTEAVLVNVLDPNREVNPAYLSYSVVTQDGRVLTGMIESESPTSITLQRKDNESDTVLRIDIEEITSTGLSLMPEGLEKEIDVQAMADLLRFLQESQ